MDLTQSLSECVRTALTKHPERVFQCRFVDPVDEYLRSLTQGHVVFEGFSAVNRRTRRDEGFQFLYLWVWCVFGYVDVEVINHFGTSIQDLVYSVWPHSVPHPGGITSDESSGVELVAVDEVAAEGFVIIGFVADVGEDEYAGLVLVAVTRL